MLRSHRLFKGRNSVTKEHLPRPLVFVAIFAGYGLYAPASMLESTEYLYRFGELGLP